MSHQYATLEDTVYFWFAANNTSGSGADGSTPVYDVRLGGAAAGAAPVLSGSATLLTHANFPDGCHEVAIAATAANGFAAGNTYGVFCTLLVDSQNPTGFVGSFNLAGVPATLSSTVIASIWTTALTEAYRSTGATGTGAQLLYEILQNITEFAISSTTKTVKKLDGSTTAKTYTLNSSTSPTSITETT